MKLVLLFGVLLVATLMAWGEDEMPVRARRAGGI